MEQRALPHSPEQREAESAESQDGRKPAARFGDRNHLAEQFLTRWREQCQCSTVVRQVRLFPAENYYPDLGWFDNKPRA